MRKCIGVLTGGGDTSALNATLKGVALKAEELGFELIGFMEGWAGVLKGGRYFTLTPDLIDENHGGTLLKSSRTNLIADNKIDEAVENLKKLKIDGLISIGGDDTLTVGAALSEQFTTTFATKTIDNDVGINPPKGDSVDYSQMVSYFCPGFPTAASRLIGYVQDLRTTAYSHDRVIIVEAMGRNAGWLTLASAYGHANLIVVPEIPYEPDRLAEAIRREHAENGNVIVVVSEGIRNQKGELMISSKEELDAFGHTRPGGCSEIIAEAMRHKLPEISNASFRHVILGHLQRCGSPIPIDRDCAIKAGQLAVRAFADGQINHVATIMRTEDGIQPKLLPLKQVIKRDKDGKVIQRSLDLRFYDAENFRISGAGIGYFRPIFGDLPRPHYQPKLDIQQI